MRINNNIALNILMCRNPETNVKVCSTLEVEWTLDFTRNTLCVFRYTLHVSLHVSLHVMGFTHVTRLALGGQAKSEHGYRIELITYHSY